jgi:hypothetical protein
MRTTGTGGGMAKRLQSAPHGVSSNENGLNTREKGDWTKNLSSSGGSALIVGWFYAVCSMHSLSSRAEFPYWPRPTSFVREMGAGCPFGHHTTRKRRWRGAARKPRG